VGEELAVGHDATLVMNAAVVGDGPVVLRKPRGVGRSGSMGGTMRRWPTSPVSGPTVLI
jgi:hypothetical protein